MSQLVMVLYFTPKLETPRNLCSPAPLTVSSIVNIYINLHITYHVIIFLTMSTEKKDYKLGKKVYIYILFKYILRLSID